MVDGDDLTIHNNRTPTLPAKGIDIVSDLTLLRVSLKDAVFEGEAILEEL